jgi:hypothetical protein
VCNAETTHGRSAARALDEGMRADQELRRPNQNEDASAKLACGPHARSRGYEMLDGAACRRSPPESAR